MAPYDRDPTAIDPRTQGSAARTFFTFVIITVIVIAALSGVYAYMNSANTVAQSPLQTEAAPPPTPPKPAPTAVPNPNPPPEPAPGQTVPDQGKPAEPGQPTPPGTGN
jgi:hypothetical protein